MAQLALSEAFESARREFLRESDKAADIDISSFTTINDVYDATDKIQKEQSSWWVPWSIVEYSLLIYIFNRSQVHTPEATTRSLRL